LRNFKKNRHFIREHRLLQLQLQIAFKLLILRHVPSASASKPPISRLSGACAISKLSVSIAVAVSAAFGCVLSFRFERTGVVAGLGKNDRSKNERSLASLRGEALAVSLRENLKEDERQRANVCVCVWGGGGGSGMFDDDG
jgi:hypothetical protein